MKHFHLWYAEALSQELHSSWRSAALIRCPRKTYSTKSTHSSYNISPSSPRNCTASTLDITLT